MTGLRAVGVGLVGLGLVYALVYVVWLRRSRSSVDQADVVEPATGAEAEGDAAGADVPGATTLATAEGTYLGTTMAISRNERVDAPGLGVSTPATMLVDETSIRWQRDGASEIQAAGTRLLGVSLQRGMAATLLGRARIVVVSWHADNGDRYSTDFRPRRRAHSTDLVHAVQQLMKIGTP